MKKIGIILFLCLIFLTGCGNSDLEEIAENSSKNLVAKQSDISTYVHYGDIQFIPVSYQHINDGTTNGLDLIQYVDLKEGTMYLYTEKYLSGYGITWTLMVDSEGNPVIYEDLEGLRERANWKESKVDNTEISTEID